MVFVSVRGRILLNVEALNMVESVGNYVKHRRVPVISPKTYMTYLVPAISGESIAHGYQEVLAEMALREGISVCDLCKKGIFLKSTNNNVFQGAFGVEPPSDENEFEKFVIKKCVVEDIGGFLYAPGGGGKQVKRTSLFSTGYMIPVGEILENVVIEPQLHSRYALGTPWVRRERGEERRGQMIYYVEISSGVYTFSFEIDTKHIGRTTFSYEHVGKEVVENDEIKRRVKVALKSLEKFLIEMMFGAKKTRFLPIVNWESLVIAVSDDVWTVTSPFSANYIENTLKKLEKINKNTRLFVYINPEVFEDTSVYVEKSIVKRKYTEAKKLLEEKGIHCFDNITECIVQAIDSALKAV